MSRTIVWFSCGAASAVASKLAVEKYDNVNVVYCDTGGEHPSNKQFLKDVERWIGKRIVILRNPKYIDHFDCIKQVKYIGGLGTAPCTLRLKKEQRLLYQELDDIQILGFTLDEKKRAERFEKYNPELKNEWILIDRELTKEDCLGLIWQQGIELPAMYKLGYNHNNCIGCVKGKKGYWNKIRKDFPDHFKIMAEIERELNYTIHRRPSGDPLYLDELNPNEGNYKKEAPITCGLGCGMIANEIS